MCERIGDGIMYHLDVGSVLYSYATRYMRGD